MVKKSKKDVYEIITEQILDQLKKGTVPWHKPWKGAGEWPKNFVSGKPYRGLNVFVLHLQGYSSPYWLTFNQAKAKGGHIKKGEKSTMVTFWKKIEAKKKTTIDTDGNKVEVEKDPYFLLRYYRVFNVEQCEGLKLPEVKSEETLEFTPIETCEQIVAGMPQKPEISHGGGRACYSPSSDKVTMPMQNSFDSEPEYYSTLFHELTHSTGHKSRLDRDEIVNLCPFGTTNYSKEELVAEMGAAFLCGEAGIENNTIDNSAAYVANWVQKFEDQPKMVVCAASAAQKAVDFILNKKFGEEEANGN
jgi:antirestriction protein ArdC